jgi:DnaJ-class molecular chaperone
MKKNQDFHSVDKAISQQIMAEQTEPWKEQCQICKGTGQMPNLPKNEILQCINCLGEGEIEYER